MNATISRLSTRLHHCAPTQPVKGLMRYVATLGAALALSACVYGNNDQISAPAEQPLQISTEGSGTVISDPNGISCGTQCTANYPASTDVTLTAVADTGFELDSWSVSGVTCSRANTCTVPMRVARAVHAIFKRKVVQFPLTVRNVGSGTVTSTPAGINCGADCTTSVNANTTMTLSATPAQGYTFGGWSGSGITCTGTDPCPVSMTQAHTVTATFNPIAAVTSYTLDVTVSSGGRVTSSPAGINSCTATCSSTYTAGTSVTLTASASAGYTFTGWNGNGLSCTTATTCTIPMSQTHSVTATFTQNAPTNYLLTVSTLGAGTVTSSPTGINCGSTCSATFTANSSVTLSATPANGYELVGWTGNGVSCGSSTTCPVTLTAARTVTATFSAVAPTNYTLTLTKSGSGTGTITSSPSGISCGSTCSNSFTSGSSVTLTAAASAGSTFASWGGACSGSATTCSVSLSQARSVTATFNTTVTTPPASGPVAGLGLSACQASGTGKDYAVGPGQALTSLDQVPWESLAAGDTVRIYYQSTPYKSKFLIAAQGTASAPVRICGVRGPNGERPIIDGNGATTRTALKNQYGSSTSVSDIHQSRSVIVIKQLATQDYQAYPRYIQIDGLNIRGAAYGNPFTDASGAAKTYTDFGACVWVDRGQNIVIADNEINNCTNGLYSKSTEDGDFAVTKNLRIAGNYFHDYGVVNDEHEHGSYFESVGIVIEYNRYGPPRSGANGNAIKDRSAGTVVRFNRIEGGAHAIDLVEAEDFPVTATALAAYRTTFVYGNQIAKSGDTGSFIHYGGDHYGSTPGATWGEPIFRKGTLYFFNNTIYATGSAAQIFQVSTTEETAEVWNNVIVFAPSVSTKSLRATSEISSPWTPGGIVNLSRNWITSGWADSDIYHTVPGQLNGVANIISGTTSPVDLTTFVPLAGSVVIDAGVAGPAGAAAYPVNAQLNANFAPVARSVNGSAIDLGAVEY